MSSSDPHAKRINKSLECFSIDNKLKSATTKMICVLDLCNIL